MKNLLCLALLLSTFGLYAQDGGKLSGTIKDQEVFDEGVVFADVHLKDTRFKTQTNFRGNFEITDVAPGLYTLEVTYLGYETLEIPVEIKAGELTRISGRMSARQLSFEDMASVNRPSDKRATSMETDLSLQEKK